MKQIIYISLLLFLALISSCIKESTMSLNYIVENNSTHSIRLQRFNQREKGFDSVMVINSGEKYQEYGGDAIGGVGWFFPRGADSIVVFFDDTISMTHRTVTSSIVPSRNIMFEFSWEGSVISEKKKHTDVESRYVFTDNDYQEAWENQ